MNKYCKRCGTEQKKFYNIDALSEGHLCADCVLELMSTDPTCEGVMQHIVKEGDDHPFAARFIYEARKGQGYGY